MTRAIITEEPIAPIIDAEQTQSIARENHECVKMIYDRDITGQNGRSIGICAFTGYGSDIHAALLTARFDGGSFGYHMSLDDAKGLRDALTEAIKAREAAVQ
jgi:hypothetical protein